MKLITGCYRVQLCNIEGFTNKCYILKVFNKCYFAEIIEIIAYTSHTIAYSLS